MPKLYNIDIPMNLKTGKRGRKQYSRIKTQKRAAPTAKRGLKQDNTLVKAGYGQQPFKTVFPFRLTGVKPGTLTTGAINMPGTAQIFMNDIHNYDGTGTYQPLYYDQLTVLYERYKIFGFAFEIKFHSPSTASAYDIGYWISASGDSPATISSFYLKEKVGVKSRLFSDKSGVVTMKGYVPLHKIIGETKLAYDGIDTIGAGFGSRPTQHIYFNVWAANKTTAGATLGYDVNFKFYGKAYELKKVVHS